VADEMLAEGTAFLFYSEDEENEKRYRMKGEI
jgi:hypothetical protein